MFNSRHSNSSHGQKVIVRGVIVTVLSIILSLLIFFAGGRQVTDMIFSDFAYAVVRGGIADDTEAEGSMEISSITDGIIDENEWVPPVSGEHYGYIVCDDINLNVPLYYGDDGNELVKGAGTSLAASLPGQGGTVLVGGHDTTFFAPLKKLKEGSVVTLNTFYGIFTYEVESIDIIEGADYDISGGREELVLYTCYPFGNNLEDRAQKIIYVCGKTAGPVIGGTDNGQ